MPLTLVLGFDEAGRGARAAAALVAALSGASPAWTAAAAAVRQLALASADTLGVALRRPACPPHYLDSDYL